MKKLLIVSVAIAAAFAGHAKAPQWRESDYKFDFPVPSNIRQIVYRSSDYKGKPREVFAWLGLPEKIEKGQKVPAVVLVHGGGGTAFLKWVERWTEMGYAAIAMDTVGHRPLKNWEDNPAVVRTRVADGGPSGVNVNTDFLDPENAWTRQAVEAVKDAHTLLLSLPEVDRENTGIIGISWGGYLTLFTAAEDHRFKAAVSVYACGFTNTKPGMYNVSEEWLKLFDPANVIAKIRCPILFITRPDDAPYPWTSWKRSTYLAKNVYRSVPGKFGHGHGCALRHENVVFMNTFLKGGAPLPEIKDVKQNGSRISAEIVSKLPIVKAELWYTTDPASVPDAKKQWNSTTLKIEKNSKHIEAELPAGTTDWFLNIRDRRAYIATALKP